MIDLELSENKIEQLIDVSTLTIPVKLRLYPGDLDELGKPINANSVIVQFKSIDYDGPVGNRFGNCKVTQINEVNFDILVVNNNLRTHRNIYTIACEVIERVRGQQILVNKLDNIIQGASPAEVTNFKFGKIGNGGSCYQSTITVKSMFTDIYGANVLL